MGKIPYPFACQHTLQRMVQTISIKQEPAFYERSLSNLYAAR
jgi:hypothetical protein